MDERRRARHALPLFHVHGLILGVLGPLRLGGAVHHLERFSSGAMAAELAGPATMMFGVPTMYHRLAADAERDPEIASGISRARLLVSGSAVLPATDHERIAATTGQHVVERYGMTETLMHCAVRADGDRRPGAVGPPLDGVDVRLIDEDGTTIGASDDDTVISPLLSQEAAEARWVDARRRERSLLTSVVSPSRRGTSLPRPG